MLGKYTVRRAHSILSLTIPFLLYFDCDIIVLTANPRVGGKYALGEGSKYRHESQQGGHVNGLVWRSVNMSGFTSKGLLGLYYPSILIRCGAFHGEEP